LRTVPGPLTLQYASFRLLLFIFLSVPSQPRVDFFQALEALAGECSSRVKGITQSLSANEAHAALKRQVEKDAKAMSAFFNVENAADDIEQAAEVQLLSEKGFTELVIFFIIYYYFFSVFWCNANLG